MDQSAFIFRVVILTLAAAVLAVIVALLIGLFSPLVDNGMIFAILGPAFHTIVGAFVGIISSRALSRRRK